MREPRHCHTGGPSSPPARTKRVGKAKLLEWSCSCDAGICCGRSEVQGWERRSGREPRSSSTRSRTTTPRKAPRKAAARRGGRAAQRPSSEACKIAVGHKRAKRMDANSERISERAGRCRTELVFPLLFDALAVPLARLPPPPALGCSVRRPGEEVDERVCGIPCDFLSPRGILRCLIPARRTWKEELAPI